MPVGAHILIADPEIAAVTKLQKRPHARGCSMARPTSSGEGAIQPAAPAQVALVLVDIGLTGIFDGTGTAQHIRRRFNLAAVCALGGVPVGKLYGGQTLGQLSVALLIQSEVLRNPVS